MYPLLSARQQNITYAHSCVMDDEHDVYVASYGVQPIFGYIMLGVAYYLLQLFVSYFGYIIDDVACNNLHHFYLKLLAAGIG